MGSLLYADGTCRFRVWAPFAKSVKVRAEARADGSNWPVNPVDLTLEGSSGNWSTDVAGVRHLDRYRYLIENVGGPGNDNSAIWQRADAHALQVDHSGASAASFVIRPFDQAARPGFSTPRFDDLILYQLHVGSFAGRNDPLTAFPVTPPDLTANFQNLIEKLPYIRDLGFNAIALLPIGQFLGDVSAGYGTSDMFAPEDAYGTSPDRAAQEMLDLVDEAHRRGLAVIFDVVYNHASPSDNRYWRYDGNTAGACSGGGGIYHEGGHDTRFGCGFAMWRQEVKDFFLDNGRMFLRDYRADGLRFDAVQFIEPDALRYIIWGLRNEFPDKYLIGEYNAWDSERAFGPLDPFGDLGLDATWDLDGYGQSYAALSGLDAVNNLLKLIGDFQNPRPWCSVRYLLGSHDQIHDDDASHLERRYLVERFGGRGNGFARAKARLAWALNVVLPGTPMLFMGSEAHLDGWWDPDASNGDNRIDWSRMGDPTAVPMRRLVQDVNNLRWAHPALRSPAGNITHVDWPGQVVAFKRYTMDGDLVLVVVNVSDNQWSGGQYGLNMGGETGSWREIFNSQAPVYGGMGTTGNFGASLDVQGDGRLYVNLPSWSVLLFQRV
jgi:1,4-alpha-glucan branching enzyme